MKEYLELVCYRCLWFIIGVLMLIRRTGINFSKSGPLRVKPYYQCIPQYRMIEFEVQVSVTLRIYVRMAPGV